MNKAIIINMKAALANAEQGRKISVAVVCGDVKKFVMGQVALLAAPLLEKDKKADISTVGDGLIFPIMRIVGLAHGHISDEGDNGPWTALKGDFVGVKLMGEDDFENPTAKRGGKLFIPAGGEDIIVSALVQSDGGAVQVGVDVFIRLNSDALLGYEYFLKPITEPTANDPLLALSETCKPLEIPAPK